MPSHIATRRRAERRILGLEPVSRMTDRRTYLGVAEASNVAGSPPLTEPITPSSAGASAAKTDVTASRGTTITGHQNGSLRIGAGLQCVTRARGHVVICICSGRTETLFLHVGHSDGIPSRGQLQAARNRS
jgi:hypothetical protein